MNKEDYEKPDKPTNVSFPRKPYKKPIAQGGEIWYQ